MDETSSAVFPDLVIDKDIGIEVRDGTVLMADAFRPDGTTPAPVIITLGPYPKDVHLKDWTPFAPTLYERLEEHGPLMHWETVNPEWWVPHGYAVVRVDARGTGKSPGRPNLLSHHEALDFHDCIEWAGAQPWSNGRVAVMGISYFAINSWRVAATRPPSLAAIVAWEGAVDAYRDIQRHGGIFSNEFVSMWSRGANPDSGDGGPDLAPPPEEYGPPYTYSNPDLVAIEVPVLSAGNWGGIGLHLRGNIEGYLGAGSNHKRLRMHTGDHLSPFYALEGRLEQLRFLEQWLKDVDTGILHEPPIKLAIRHSRDGFQWRYEYEWPLARTQWAHYYLDAGPDRSLRPQPPATSGVADYAAAPDQLDSAVRFSTSPFTEATEITGPLALHAWVSTSGTDADLFVVIRDLGPDDEEVTFHGVLPVIDRLAVAYGWLRLSHRHLAPDASTPWRPVHDHIDLQPVQPDEIVAVDIEIWPTSMVFAPGHRLVLEIRAHDDPAIAPFRHTHPTDRRWGGTIRIHTGGEHNSHLLLPVIPRR